MPHKQVTAEYGEPFAKQQQNTRDTLLRTPPTRKRLVDWTNSSPPTPRKKRTSDLDSLALNFKRLSLGDRPGVKRRPLNSWAPATAPNVAVAKREKHVSAKDRPGVKRRPLSFKRRPLNSWAPATAPNVAVVDREERVSVKDRLGVKRTPLNSWAPDAAPTGAGGNREERVSVKDRLGVPVSANNRSRQRGYRLRSVHRMCNERPDTKRLTARRGGYRANPRRDSYSGVYLGSRANTFRKTYNNRRT